MIRREPKTLLHRMGFADPDLSDPLHDELLKWINYKLKERDFDALGIRFHPESISNELQSYRWEYPVESSPNMLAGFLDVFAVFKPQYRPEFLSSFNPGGERWKLGFEKPRLLLEIGFEAKVILPDLGTLFRQLSVYRHFGYPNLVVICLDDVPESSIEIIREQGYGFVKICLDLPK